MIDEKEAKKLMIVYVVIVIFLILFAASSFYFEYSDIQKVKEFCTGNIIWPTYYTKTYYCDGKPFVCNFRDFSDSNVNCVWVKE